MTPAEYNARMAAFAAREARHQERMACLRLMVPFLVGIACAYGLGALTVWACLRW